MMREWRSGDVLFPTCRAGRSNCVKRKCPGRHETPAPERLERRTNDVHPESHVVAIVCEPLHWCAGDPTGELNLSTAHSRPTRFLVRVIVQNMQFRLLPGGASSYDCLPERSSIMCSREERLYGFPHRG